MANKIFILVFTLLTLASGSVFAQPEDPVLFIVEGTPVHVSEFEYIYTKTNGEKAEFDEPSLREYLELYKDFKLKVKRARDLKLDTIKVLQQELAGYKRQLSNNYLMDKEVTEKLLREAYDRSQYDVAVSHILFRADKNTNQKQIKIARQNAYKALKRLQNGEAFEKVAAEVSEHPPSKSNGGYIGYFTALELPNFYELETAAYTTPKGQISDIIKTRLGYHIIKVMDKRPARGQIKASHILIRVDKSADQSTVDKTKNRINEVYQQLKDGGKFEDLAQGVSEDNTTGKNGGLIGTFGINKYEEDFENAVFGLKNDGDYTSPVRSSLGWHIIKRIEKPEPLPYELAKGGLINRIKRDSRYAIAQEAMVARIKESSGYKENTAFLNDFFSNLGEDYVSPNWEVPSKDLDKEVFGIGDMSYSLQDFIAYNNRNRNLRVRRGRQASPQDVGKEMFKDFSDKTLIKYEESQLEKKYPDFKSLMREYEEGILLFEATKRLVWDKANEDSTGLQMFYNQNKESYKWAPRAKVNHFTLATADEKTIAKTYKLAKKKSTSALLSKINKKGEVLLVEEEISEQGKNELLDKLAWQAGTVTDLKIGKEASTFSKIETILPAEPKSLKEARGYVVADYQDHLLNEWVEQLRGMYSVKVDESVFRSLVGKR
ncbi:MAG: peptidylprolyl isomerase [Bacteroidota bacterium]